MEAAVKACLEGNGFSGAAKEFQVPSLTLKREIRKQWEIGSSNFIQSCA
jgi:hypothetical protein